ncbi:MAG: hypothetical protein AD742_04725 [Methylibium sp. NZG]|nr:MAG: hypothetical protein AD742_04725 [Methylibium sp. NZG]
MVLGHDFHSVAGYEWSRAHQAENLDATTWLHLRNFLNQVSIPFENCFFTNIYMGPREGTAVIGRFPGANDPLFVRRCQQFFLQQIVTQRPRLILALGSHVPPLLAPLSHQLEPWASQSSFPSRDANETSLRENVKFNAVNVLPCVVASIVHPCMRNSNVRHRRWRNLRGDAAEIALVQHAVRQAGL